MRPVLFGIAIGFLLGCISSTAAADDDEPAALGWVEKLHHGAGLFCRFYYGDNHLTVDERDTLKYYCARLEHPIEWAQDQKWWKEHLPSFLQAATPPEKNNNT